jgi:putative ABC transport system ATP-binding protein
LRLVVEREGQPLPRGGGGVSRNPSIDHPRFHARGAQRRFQLGRIALPRFELVSGIETVAKRQDHRGIGRNRCRRGRAGGAGFQRIGRLLPRAGRQQQDRQDGRTKSAHRISQKAVGPSCRWWNGRLQEAGGLCHFGAVTSPAPLISARALTLSLGRDAARVDILKGLDLDVMAGETVALLGPSGSGKSSLLAVLSGLERASSGVLFVAGADFATLEEDGLATARRGRIGIVLQAFHLLPTMTARENVATPMELAGMTDAMSRAEAELAAVGLAHRLDHYPGQLSGGEQQRVAIARALAPRPALLFADEPTGNLDAATGTAVADLLFDRARQAGATLLMVTHDEALAQRCGRILRLADGRIASDETR